MLRVQKPRCILSFVPLRAQRPHCHRSVGSLRAQDVTCYLSAAPLRAQDVLVSSQLLRYVLRATAVSLTFTPLSAQSHSPHIADVSANMYLRGKVKGATVLLYLQLFELHVRCLNTEGVCAGIDLGAGGRGEHLEFRRCWWE